MLNIENYRVVVLDERNYTFEVYRQTQNPMTREYKSSWKQDGGYYGTLDQCLKALKDCILRNYLTENDANVEETLKQIDSLNNSYINCIIKLRNIKEGENNEDV